MMLIIKLSILVFGLMLVWAWLMDHCPKFGYWFDKNIFREDEEQLMEEYGRYL